MASRLAWDEPRDELGGVSPVAWVADRRGRMTARQLATELSRLLKHKITITALNVASNRKLPVLTEAQRKALYHFRGADLSETKPVLTLQGDVLVLADAQIPYHDADFIERCINLAVRWGVENCVLAGDFADMQSLNSFGQAASRSLGEELKAIRGMLRLVRRSFRRVVYINGNHEERVGRSSDGRIAFRDLLADFFGDGENPGVVEFSERYYCYVGDQWVVTHPVNAGSIAARVPFSLAAKLHRNVISTHNHLWGAATDISGKYHVIDAGMCAHPDQLEYYQMRHNTRPAMVQGAVIIKRGKAWHLNPTLTDWPALGTIDWGRKEKR